MKRVTFLTDVRFWQRRTGAHQRIWALVEYLSDHFDVNVLFAAPLENGDRELLAESDVNVLSLVDDWQPDGLIEKAKWKGKCLLNSVSPKEEISQSKTLAELQTKEFVYRAKSFFEKLKPGVVIAEYVTMDYLVPPPRERAFVALLDAHDLLSARCEEFHQRQHEHWLAISQAEEASVFGHFDAVLAIQTAEAEKIQNMTDRPVIVVGHPVGKTVRRRPNLETVDEGPGRKTRVVGYIASDNAANREGLETLLEIRKQVVSERFSFWIAGAVCSGYEQGIEFPGVRLVGPVDDLGDFYRAIDIAINPVLFGSGLKLKNMEAIAYGKPLILSRHASLGMPELGEEAKSWLVANTEAEFVDAILRLGKDVELFQRLSNKAVALGDQLTADKVYADLVDLINKSGS